MMYFLWFIEFVFNTLIVEPITFAVEFVGIIIDCAKSVITLVGVFPEWLSIPFIAILSIAVLFRVSQFIPSLGGASS